MKLKCAEREQIAHLCGSYIAKVAGTVSSTNRTSADMEA